MLAVCLSRNLSLITVLTAALILSAPTHARPADEPDSAENPRAADIQAIPFRMSGAETAVAENRAVPEVQALKNKYGAGATFSRFDASSGRVERLSQADVELRTDQYLAVSGGNIGTESLKVGDTTFSLLPTVFVKLEADGTRQELRVGDHTEGLFWQPGAGHYLGELFLAVLDPNNPGNRSGLNPPIPVQLSGPPGSVAEQPILIRRLGVPAVKTDVVTEAGGTSLALTIHSDLEPNGKRAVTIPYVKPTLRLVASPSVIDGFGLQATRVTLSDPDGAGPGPGLTFTLDYDDGKPANAALQPDERGSAYTTEFWSTGVGTVTLSVNDSRFEIAPVDVRIRMPYGFLFATVLGAVLGATALVFWRRWRDPTGAYLWSWLASLAFAIGAVLITYAGFDLPQVPGLPELLRDASIAPFGLAFICAFFVSAIVTAFNR